MRNILLGSIACVAMLSSGCLNNGEATGNLVMKCYYDTENVVWSPSANNESWIYTVEGYTRHVFEEYTFDLGSADTDATIVGRLNVDNEFQFTAFVECDTDCRKECKLPADAVLREPAVPPYADYPDNPEYEGFSIPDLPTYIDGPVDVERLTMHVVAGRNETPGVAEEDWELYSPAYYIAKGPNFSSSGACIEGEDYDALRDVDGNEYGDNMAFAVGSINVFDTGFFTGSDTVDENGCSFLPWAQLTVDNPEGAVKGGAVTGTAQVGNFEIRGGDAAAVMVELNGGDAFTPVTFSIDGIIADSPLEDTIVTKNNDLFDLGL